MLLEESLSIIREIKPRRVVDLKKIYILFVLNLFCYELMAGNIVKLTIDYGEIKPMQVIDVWFEPKMSALELLDKAAEIKTKEVGEYVFVTSINGVKSHSKTMGWFYDVDGSTAKKTASKNILDSIKTMRWEFKIANCGE